MHIFDSIILINHLKFSKTGDESCVCFGESPKLQRSYLSYAKFINKRGKIASSSTPSNQNNNKIMSKMQC